MAGKKVIQPEESRKSRKLSPSDWKAGTKALHNLGPIWCGHREKRPLVSKTSRNAKSNNPATWGEWKEAAAFYERTQQDPLAGAGIMMSAERGVVCLDLDHCYGPDRLPLPWAQPILHKVVGRTYDEVSLSGNGNHAIFKLTRPLHELLPGITRSKGTVKLGGADGAVEFFSEPHYVTVSGDVYLGSDKLGDADEVLVEILESTGLAALLRKPHASAEAEKGPLPPERRQEELDTATHALQAIDPDVEREVWLQLGMALKAAFQGAGWGPWYEWSARGEKFEQGACEKAWGSFQGTGVGLGTLYHHAREAGWGGSAKKSPLPPRTSAQEDFREFVSADHDPVPATPARGAVEGDADLVDGSPDPTEPEDYQEGNLEAWQAIGLHIVTGGSPKNPVVKPSEGDANVGLYLERHGAWKGRLRYNERTMEVELDGSQGGLDLHRLTRHLVWFMHWRRSPSENSVLNAAMSVAKVRRYDPVRVHLKSLKWDGAPRLSDLCAMTGLEVSEITSRMLRRWCIGAVARAMQPGVEMQNMLVLHGGQGVGKSTFFKKLAMKPEWYTESKVEIGTKDGQLALVRSWIVEMGELSTMAKAQVEETKSFISQSHAEFRPPYGRKTESFPRRCVLGGTTNDDEWMRDGTGSRRFWLIAMEDVGAAHKLTPALVEQIWAEAVVAYRAGERWWDEGEEVREVTERNAEHYQSVGLDGLVENALANVKSVGVTSGFILRELVSNQRVNPGTPRKLIAQAMERCGWKMSRIRPVGYTGTRPRIYRRPGAADPATDHRVRSALILAFQATGAGADFVEEPSEGSPAGVEGSKEVPEA